MLFGMDAAAISLVFAGAASGTLGSSGAAGRAYDELQFTFGEGPCLDSVARRAPVLVADLANGNDGRWPAYGPAMLDYKIHGIFAIPVVVAGEFVGALDLFRAKPGELHVDDLAGAVVAAELAGMPLLDLMHSDLQAAVNDPDNNLVLISGDGDWASHQVTARVLEDSNSVIFGVFLAGPGRIEMRNAELARAD